MAHFLAQYGSEITYEGEFDKLSEISVFLGDLLAINEITQ